MNIECPHCNSKLEAEKEHLGQTVECPSCSKAFTVKQPSKPPPTPPPKTKPAHPAFKACPFCSENINFYAQKCKHCGEFLNQKNSKQTESKMNPALYGCAACLIVGGIINFISNFLFIFWIPLYLAAFILSIVGIAQGKTSNGIAGLLLSIFLPLTISTINIIITGSALKTALDENASTSQVIIK